MLVVYMLIVQDAVHAYVELWNHHKIRKQPNRPNAVTSQPIILYHYPLSGVHLYKVLVNREYISQIEDSLQEWGMLYFLTPLFNSDCTIAKPERSHSCKARAIAQLQSRSDRTVAKPE